MEFGIEKCAIVIRKSREREITQETELPNQEKIRTIREKETYRYLGKWEVDIIKQAETKEKNKKRIPLMNEKTSRNQALQQKYHQRDKYQGNFSCKIL